MILDTLNNGEKYYSPHPNFKVAFDYLNFNWFECAWDWRIEIAPGVKAIVSDSEGKTAEVALQKFECHNKNIDIQVCIRGSETIGWKPRQIAPLPKAKA